MRHGCLKKGRNERRALSHSAESENTNISRRVSNNIHREKNT